MNLLDKNNVMLSDKVLLEIGPGINYGSILLLACGGARVIVADRFLAPWDKEYHPKFYYMLRDWVSENMPEGDKSVLDDIITSESYPRDRISCYSSDIESLKEISETSVDIVFSNAVLEHIYNPEASFQNMARITKPKGFGFHQVDFRDHRDFKKPLEYLLLDEGDFAREFAERHGECGNRYRPMEYDQMFKAAGFQILDFEPNIFTKDSYLKSLIPRLRDAQLSNYQNIPVEALRTISGLYTLVKNE